MNALELTVCGHRLEVLRIPGRDRNTPELVLLHEGLGSVMHWRDFPLRVASATGCPVTLYSRYGSGKSDLLAEPRPVTYMHDEALQSLPNLLAQLNIKNPILIGHSDGGSIALIHAGAHDYENHDHANHDRPNYDHVRGLILFAPHVFVEDLSIASIAQARIQFTATDLAERLSCYHRDAARTFWGWNNVWLHPDFRSWNIEEYLPRVQCPILAIQGVDDEYGTMAQVQAIARQSGGPVEILSFANCRHSPHRDQPEAVLKAIAEFVNKSVEETPHR